LTKRRLQSKSFFVTALPAIDLLQINLTIVFPSPPGNRLEDLKGDLEGFHSIRVNDQWRIIFRWNDGVYEVSLVDYH